MNHMHEPHQPLPIVQDTFVYVCGKGSILSMRKGRARNCGCRRAHQRAGCASQKEVADGVVTMPGAYSSIKCARSLLLTAERAQKVVLAVLLAAC